MVISAEENLKFFVNFLSTKNLIVSTMKNWVEQKCLLKQNIFKNEA